MLASLTWLLILAPQLAAVQEPRADEPEVHDAPALVEEAAPPELPDDLRAALDDVLALRDGGDAEGARARLKALVESDVYAALLGENEAAVMAGMAELHSIADSLGALEAQRTVAEERVRRLERTLPAEDDEVLGAKLDLAVVLRLLGDLRGALGLEEEVHGIWERTPPAEDAKLLRAKLNLAITRQALGDIEGAGELLEYVHSVRARELAEDDPALLRVELNLATTRRTLGDLRGALELEEHVYSVWKAQLPAEDPDLLRATMNLAVTRQSLGDTESASKLLEEVHTIRERLLPADHPDLLAAKINLAWIRWTQGDLVGASELMEYVHAIWEKQLPPDHPRLLSAKGNLALTRGALGDVEGALELQEYVHAAQERVLPPDHPELVLTKMNLAGTRRTLGDLDGALELLEYVRRSREGRLPADHPDLLSVKQTLAGVRSAQGDFRGALELDEEVYAGRLEQLPEDHRDLLRAKDNLAMSRLLVGDVEGANELLEETHASWERLVPADHPSLIAVKKNLAVARMRLRDLEGARELDEQVYAAWKELLPPGHPHLLAAELNLALKRRAVGDLEGGQELAGLILEGVRTRAVWMHGQSPRLARGAARALMPRLEGALLASRGEDSEPRAKDELFAAFESLRLVSTDSSEVAFAAQRHPEVRALSNRVALVRRDLGGLGASPPQDPAEVEAWRQRMLELGEERDGLQRELRLLLAQNGLELDAPSVDAVARALPGGHVFVSLFCYRRFFDIDPRTGAEPPPLLSVLAFVVTSDAEVRLVELGPSDELERLAEAWRDALGAPVTTNLASLRSARGQPIEGSSGVGDEKLALDIGRELRERVLDPCLDGVEPPAGVHLVLDDFLHLVPIDALPWSDDRYTGEVLDVFVESSARRLMRGARSIDGEGTLVAFGGIAFDAGDVPEKTAGLADETRFAPLPQTAGEIESVAKIFGDFVGRDPVTLRGSDATKSALTELAPSARFLHVATHGWFAADTFPSEVDALDLAGRELLDRADRAVKGYAPESLCGLAFAGANHGANDHGRSPGILTAEELATLDLTHCELAVLSACETNVGLRRAGQGIQSLQTALHAAGARSAITSLWRVDDAATRRLMERFYTGLWQDGLGKADALWQAKMELRAMGSPARDWAGWVLTGAPE